MALTDIVYADGDQQYFVLEVSLTPAAAGGEVSYLFV